MRLLLAAALSCALVLAYPLDGDKRTGIRRLLGYRLAQSGQVKGPKVPPGGQWGTEQVRLRLPANRSLDVTAASAKDPALQRGLEQILGGRNESYGMAVLDITDPQKPRYAAVREDESQLPGSVGKLLVVTGMFDALKRAYPEVAARERLLRETIRAADGFVIRDGKTVPFFEPGAPAVVNRQIAPGDRFSLWEWMDHMLSQSSNAAGSFTWKEAVLLRKFGTRYPVSAAEEKQFLGGTPKPELHQAALETLEAPLTEAGLQTAKLRLGTMFTSGGSRVFPGAKSYATPRELLRWLIRMEQGRLVDEWSSLEMKRLIYFARPRYRYASAPSLNNAAVFFKSGSFFECVPEPGFTCKPYAGNKTNIMNSVAVVESRGRIYLATLMSNVLRTNSAVEHQRIAGLVEALVQAAQPGVNVQR
jgi:hypothetical protein